MKPAGVACFTRQSRLVSARDYQRVFDNARRSSSALMTVLVRQNEPSPSPARLGLIVSKKTEKTAVGRNRIKRLVRESFRHNQLRLAGLDIIVLARRGITIKANREIVSDLERHWTKLERLCEKP